MVNISINFIKQLKKQILSSRYIVAKIANAESLKLYFTIGKLIEEQFAEQKWGSKIIDDISMRLQQELPGLRGFSGQNLRKMRVFYQEWNSSNTIYSSMTSKLEEKNNPILPSLTSKLDDNENITRYRKNKEAFLSVSFTHHYEIILKIKNKNDRWYYINKNALPKPDDLKKFLD